MGRLRREASSSSISVQSKASSVESCSSKRLSRLRMKGKNQSGYGSVSGHDSTPPMLLPDKCKPDAHGDNPF